MKSVIAIVIIIGSIYFFVIKDKPKESNQINSEAIVQTELSIKSILDLIHTESDKAEFPFQYTGEPTQDPINLAKGNKLEFYESNLLGVKKINTKSSQEGVQRISLAFTRDDVTLSDLVQSFGALDKYYNPRDNFTRFEYKFDDHRFYKVYADIDGQHEFSNEMKVEYISFEAR